MQILSYREGKQAEIYYILKLPYDFENNNKI